MQINLMSLVKSAVICSITLLTFFSTQSNALEYNENNLSLDVLQANLLPALLDNEFIEIIKVEKNIFNIEPSSFDKSKEDQNRIYIVKTLRFPLLLSVINSAFDSYDRVRINMQKDTNGLGMGTFNLILSVNSYKEALYYTNPSIEPEPRYSSRKVFRPKVAKTNGSMTRVEIECMAFMATVEELTNCLRFSK